MAQRFRTDVAFGCIAILCILTIVSGCRGGDEELDIVNISNTPGYSEYPDIAVDSRGTFYVVWDEQLVTQESLFIYLATRSPNGEWSKPEKIFAPRAAQFAKIEVDKYDRLHVVWRNTDPDGWGEVLYTKRLFNGAWTEPDTLSKYGISASPDFAIDEDGNIHLVWQEMVGDWPVFYSKRSSNGYWSYPIEITRGDVFWRGEPQMAVSPQGDVHVVWEETKFYEGPIVSVRTLIMYTTNADGDTFCRPQVIYPHVDAIDEQIDPTIAVDNNGTVHAAWRQYSDILCTFRLPDREWQTPVRVCSTDAYAYQPVLSEDAEGTLYVVWFEGERKLGLTSKADGNWETPHYYDIDIGGLMDEQLAISAYSVGIVVRGVTECDAEGRENSEVFFIEIPRF